MYLLKCLESVVVANMLPLLPNEQYGILLDANELLTANLYFHRKLQIAYRLDLSLAVLLSFDNIMNTFWKELRYLPY